MGKTLIAVSTLTGTIIGAGIFGIPYLVAKCGLLLGILNMVIIAAMMTLIYLYLGEISLRTKGDHQLSGYASQYLGKKGKVLMIISLAFGVYTALAAYLFGESESLSILIFNSPRFSLLTGLVFWIVMTSLVYFGIKALKDGEEIGLILVSSLIIAIIVLYWNKVEISNLNTFSPKAIFSPFGIILFAFLGFSAIPEIKKILGKETNKMKKVILYGNLIALGVYLIFTTIVLGLKGSSTPPLATLALGKPFILLGIITMTTAYLANANALVESFRYDLYMHKRNAWLLTSLVPPCIFIITYFVNNSSFTTLLSIGGVVSAGLSGILILIMVPKAKKKGNRNPEYSIPYSRIIALVFIIIFIIAAGVEIAHAI